MLENQLSLKSLKKDKLQRSLGGIAEMKKVPDLVFIIDTNFWSRKKYRGNLSRRLDNR